MNEWNDIKGKITVSEPWKSTSAFHSVCMQLCCFSDIVLTHSAVLTLSSEAEHWVLFEPFPSKSNNILFVLNKQSNAAIPHSLANEDFISANARNN